VLLPPEPSEQAVPASVYNVAAQLLSAEEGIDDHPDSRDRIALLSRALGTGLIDVDDRPVAGESPAP
jgi:hypothetical protein